MLPINLHLTGTSHMTGYGKMAIALWRALILQGALVVPTGRYDPDVFRRLPPAAGRTPEGFVPTSMPSLVIGDPHEVMRYPHLWRTRPWLFTMLETNRMAEEWVTLINQRFVGVLVPSPDQVDILQYSGVTVPVRYVPLGVDFFVREPVDNRLQGQRIFMAYSLGGSRKGANTAIRAFKQAFEDRPDCQLWIKCSNPEGSFLQGCEDHQVRVISGFMHELEWRRWLSRVNFFVFPSLGEGRGFPPIEATLEGVPTTATRWLGLWDIDQWGWGIPVRMMVPHSIMGGGVNAEGALWADPDADHLTQTLLWLESHEEEARIQALHGRSWLLETYPWSRTADEVLALLEVQP